MLACAAFVRNARSLSDTLSCASARYNTEPRSAATNSTVCRSVRIAITPLGNLPGFLRQRKLNARRKTPQRRGEVIQQRFIARGFERPASSDAQNYSVIARIYRLPTRYASALGAAHGTSP